MTTLPIEESCVLEEDFPAPVVLIIGGKSVGKSTFANYLRGNSNQSVTCGFKIGAGNGSASVTKAITATTAYWWFGKDGEDNFTILDTPGLANPNGADEYRNQFKEVLSVLKNIKKIHAIVQVVKGKKKEYQKPDYYDENMELLKYMFGEAMKTHLINEVTFWKNFKYHERERVEFAKKMNKSHQDLFSDSSVAITTVFIDPIEALEEPYKTEFKSLSHGCPNAKMVQTNQIDKLKEFLWTQRSKPFNCSEKCGIVEGLFTTRSPYPTGSPYLYRPIKSVASPTEIIQGTFTVLGCKIASLMKVDGIDTSRVKLRHNNTMIKHETRVHSLVLNTLKIIPDEDAHFIHNYYFNIGDIKWDNAGTYTCYYDDLHPKNNLVITVTGHSNCKVGYDISPWSEWSECVGICGNATQARNRTIKETIKNGSSECDALTDEHRDCNPRECKGQIISILY